MTALSSLLARKGEALPAARRNGPESWFGDSDDVFGGANAPRRLKGAPIDDETVEAADLVALIAPMSLRASEKPAQSAADPDLPALKQEKKNFDPIAKEPQRRLLGGGPAGPGGFFPVVRQEDDGASEASAPRRQMTLRLPMEMFKRLKDYVMGKTLPIKEP